MHRRRTLIGIGLTLTLLAAAMPTARAAQPIHDEPALYWYRGLYADGITAHDAIEGVAGYRLGDGPFVHEYPILTAVSLLELEWTGAGEPVTYYNFRAPVCFLVNRLVCLIEGDGFWILEDDPQLTWWTALLRAPNNSYKLRLSRELRLAATTRTDLLPFRINGGDQGVLFTPQIALEWVGLSSGYENDKTPATNRLHVGVGYANWWSFEGDSRTPGWTFVIGVAFLAGV